MSEPPAEHDQAPQPATRPDHHGGSERPAVIDHDAKKRRRRKRVRLLVLAVLLIALLIALTPTLLSTGPGTRWLVSFINNRVPGELAVDDLKIRWLGGQRVDGLAYDDPGQGLNVTVESVQANDLSLFSLLRGSRRFGEVWLTKPEVVYAEPGPQPADTDTPVSLPKAAPKQPERFRVPRDLSGTVVFDQLTLTYLSPDAEPIVLTSKQDQVQVNDIRDITFSFSSTVRQGAKSGRVELMGGVLNLFDFDGAEQADKAAFNGKFSIDGVTTSALDQVLSGLTGRVEPGRISRLLGAGDIFTVATLDGTIDQLESDLTIQTPKLRVGLEQRTEGKTLIASPASYAELDLDQDSFAALFPDSGLTLHKPTMIDLESLAIVLPIVDGSVDWGAATASLQLKAGDELAVVDERGGVLGINDLRVTGGAESIAGKLSFRLTTQLSAVNDSAQVTNRPIAVDLDVLRPLEPTREIAFFSEGLPIGLVDALVGKGWDLPLWLGETLTLDADLRGERAADQSLMQRFSLRPDGRLTGTVTGSLSDGGYRISTPPNEPVEAVLTPQAFARLMEMVSGREGEPALTIAQDMPVFLTLQDPERGEVAITTRPGKTGLKRFYPDPDETYLGVMVELSPATVFDPKLKKTYELRGGSLSVYAPDLRGKTRLRAELELWVRPDAGKQGVASLLTWDTTVTDLLDTEGSIPLDAEALMQQIAAAGGMQLKNVPSGLMDTLFSREGDLASILGPIVQSMDAGFTYQDGQPTGATVRLNWDEKNNQPLPDAWASMKPAAFDIDGDQMMTVRGGQDLELEVRISEAFGDRWMGQLHPILFDAKSGDRPVKIRIDGKSFRFPLKGEAMRGSRVEAQVDLGTVTFGEDALLGRLMEWTDRPGERAVFEPATVKLVDGKISYDEFDLAVGKVKLRLDGEVDLVSGQIVDMAVRVPGDSLIRVFNELDGVIPKDDYLSIPMTGEIRQPQFDSRLIGREVARLLAQGLIDQQKDKLKDLIREGVGGGDMPDAGEGDPAEEPEKSIEEQLLDQGLDLLFRRLGRDPDEPGQE